jgi:6-phosphogluconolactonase
MNTARGEVLIFDDPIEVARAAAERFARSAQAVLADRQSFSVALAGGSTPRAMYEILAQKFGTRVDWSRVDVFFGDERCVAADHPDSNYRMAREALLDHVPLGADRVHRMLGELDPEEAARKYEATLARVLGPSPHIGLVLLGMGGDGHTASLFPGTPALDERTRLVVANRVDKLNAWRLTLTYAALNAGREVIITTTGSEKADALATVFNGPDLAVPIQAIRPESGRLTWLVDRKAAAKLAL